MRRCNDYLAEQLARSGGRSHPVAIVDFEDLDVAGWADIGWNDPAGASVGGLVRLANSQRAHAAQNMFSAVLFGGVFARRPALTVLFEALRGDWGVPPFIEMLERQSLPLPALGKWPFPVSGGEMLRRNLRLTPLPGFGDDCALEILQAMPERVVWSSDYPHQEANADPNNLSGDALERLGPGLRGRFLGGTMQDCFARMGDPLAGRAT